MINDTGKRERVSPSEVSAFHLEANRTPRGMSLIIEGVIGVCDFSSENITLSSHSGRVCVSGKRLLINVYENRSVEILGKVEAISFKYGKN